MSRYRRKASIGSLVVLIASVLVGLVSPRPAAADDCGTYEAEADLMATPDGDHCRGAFLVDPGARRLLDRAQLVGAKELYKDLGFPESFLWYAPESIVTIGAGNDQRWNSCASAMQVGGTCVVGGATGTSRVRDTFSGNPVTLSVFGTPDGNGFIARVCGNAFLPIDVPPPPTPFIDGFKFHDRNLDGAQQGDEGPLAGWEFELHRISSLYDDQARGYLRTTTSATDGSFTFDLRNDGPGTYEVREVVQAGFTVSTGAARTVVVEPGKGGVRYGPYAFGNAGLADAVKVSFTPIDIPERIEADAPTTLAAQAVVRNDGPAGPVDIEDFVTVTGPADCTIAPVTQSYRRRLGHGEAVTLRFEVTVTCTEPSFHRFDFQDRLEVTTPGVTDPDPTSNSAAFGLVIPVFDRSDLSVDDVATDCPARVDVDVEVNCVTTTVVTNRGPHGPTTADVTTTLAVPGDCTATPDDAVHGVDLAVGASATVSTVWTLVCADRSFHPVSATSSVAVTLIHVEDLVDPNNSRTSATDVLEVFEAADLAVGRLRISCDQRETNGLSSSCTSSVPASNLGPADQVQLVVTLDLVPGEGCSRTPDAVATQLTLATGATSIVSQTWTVTCPTTARHAIVGTAEIRTDEPHAEDRDLANNRTRTTWIPQDAKPRSLPSSVNIGKEGQLPLALLSTPELDTLVEVDRSTVTAGSTGLEAAATCSPTGEDVNDDGLADLVCRIPTASSGLSCTSTELVVRGRLTDGSAFESQDTINVVPCRR